MAIHTPAMCQPVPGTEIDVAVGHAGKSCGWSKQYRCPECGRTGRFNTNFLGRRHVVCDGKAFQKVADTLEAIRASGVDMRREALRAS